MSGALFVKCSNIHRVYASSTDSTVCITVRINPLARAMESAFSNRRIRRLMTPSYETMSDTHPLIRLETIVLIGIGGFAGSNLRYFVAELLPGLPGTLIANATGSFVLGFILYEAMYSGLLAEQTHWVAATGFLSSFTTYSTFALQTALASPIWMVGNVFANYALGISGVLLGRAFARMVGGAGGW